MARLELLAPAGNLEKLKVAFYYGADAVYVGGKHFSLRSYADNFTDAELKEAVAYAHGLGKKIYVTVNIFAKNADFEPAAAYFKYLESIGADSALITDPGLVLLAKEVAPNLPIHLSTQANTLNKYAVAFWQKQGIERIVLARELSLEEINDIRLFNPNIELEAFVHGAMCISYSGRCLMSNYLTARDANRGECVQACRWNYSIKEISPFPRAPLALEQDERGTYFLNSKDLNMIEHISGLAQSGVISFKIEGRMKSEYYLATVINAYRRAIDEYYACENTTNIAIYNEELLKVSHREYTKAYYLGANDKTVRYDDEQNNGTYDFIAIVNDYHSGMATIEMRNRFAAGDILEILSPYASFNCQFAVESITNSRGQQIDDAKLVQEILTIGIPFVVAKGDILRRKRKIRAITNET